MFGGGSLSSGVNLHSFRGEPIQIETESGGYGDELDGSHSLGGDSGISLVEGSSSTHWDESGGIPREKTDELSEGK